MGLILSPRLVVGASTSLSLQSIIHPLTISSMSLKGATTRTRMPPQLGQALAITPSPHQPKELIYKYAIIGS